MHEPLTPAYLREIQTRITETRPGPWPVTGGDGAVGFGPFSWVEAWDDTELGPAIEFCRHARTDVRALLGEVARLTDRLGQMERDAARRPVVVGGRGSR
ncbi:hypothetical protein AB0P17_36380 [Streptomyces sp. NPDC088124]|uniref:hypothetical protein n=1 Tax=Streptomyces sp. NPDC088124 TaxID=3154654 RepID=UPI00342640F2